MKYRIVRGNVYDVENEVNKLLSNGFEIVGGLIPYSLGEVAQAVIEKYMVFDPTGKYEQDSEGNWVPRGVDIPKETPDV